LVKTEIYIKVKSTQKYTFTVMSFSDHQKMGNIGKFVFSNI